MIRFTLLLILSLFIHSASVFSQSEHLFGRIAEEQIRSEHSIFDIYTKRYAPDSLSVQFLQGLQDSVHITTIMGTWCKDSKKYVPALMKTIELANNPLISVEYIGVEYSGEDPTGAYQKYGLHANPTFIVFLNGKEIHRIVEIPDQSIEEDLMKAIIEGKSASQ